VGNCQKSPGNVRRFLASLWRVVSLQSDQMLFFRAFNDRLFHQYNILPARIGPRHEFRCSYNSGVYKNNVECFLIDSGAAAASQPTAAAEPSQNDMNSSSDVSRFHVDDSRTPQLNCESRSDTDSQRPPTAADGHNDMQTAEDILNDLDNS